MLSRGRLRAALVLVTVVGLLGFLPASPAAAQECGFEMRPGPDGVDVLVWTCGASWPGGGSGGEWVCEVNFQGQPMRVPCVNDPFGWFTTALGGCYIKPANPQPPAGHPDWDGHDPSEGVVYDAACFVAEGVDGLPFFRLPTTIFMSAADGFLVDLLEQAIALLPMSGPDIQIAPDPAGAGLVGLPVWMWTPQTESTWGPLSASLTSLGVTVEVTANADRIRWDMGDGGERICEHPGTEYQPEFGADESPTCGYAYEQPSRDQPDGRYAVTGVTEWQIDWEVAGTAISGTELRTRASSTSVRINELQVVTS